MVEADLMFTKAIFIRSRVRCYERSEDKPDRANASPKQNSIRTADMYVIN